MIQLSRKIFFCCSLRNKDKYTGLNLTLEVFFTGEVNKESNLVINFFEVDSFLKTTLINWDHKEFENISFSDLAEICALDVSKNWPFFEKVKLDKIHLFVKEPFKQVAVSF